MDEMPRVDKWPEDPSIMVVTGGPSVPYDDQIKGVVSVQGRYAETLGTPSFLGKHYDIQQDAYVYNNWRKGQFMKTSDDHIRGVRWGIPLSEGAAPSRLWLGEKGKNWSDWWKGDLYPTRHYGFRLRMKLFGKHHVLMWKISRSKLTPATAEASK